MNEYSKIHGKWLSGCQFAGSQTNLVIKSGRHLVTFLKFYHDDLFNLASASPIALIPCELWISPRKTLRGAMENFVCDSLSHPRWFYYCDAEIVQFAPATHIRKWGHSTKNYVMSKWVMWWVVCGWCAYGLAVAYKVGHRILLYWESWKILRG